MAENKKTATRAPLERRQIENMLAVLVRDEKSFLAARPRLLVSTFPARHAGYAAVWAIVNDHYDQFGELPDAEMIATELEARVNEDLEFTDSSVRLADEFLSHAFGIPRRVISQHVKTTFSFLRQYLDDRTADELRDKLTGTHRTPQDMFKFTQMYQEQASANAVLSPKPLPKMFSPGWDKTESLKLDKLDTGSDFLNSFLDGGIARGEVLGLLGPHGSCKTTMAIQIGTDVANLAYLRWLADKKIRLDFSYHFFWEGTMPEMRLRALSHAGKISKNSLEIGDIKALSRGRRLKDYERSLFRNEIRDGHPVMSEYDRYYQTQEVLNVNYRSVDMTGNDPEAPGRGAGLVDEIVAMLRMEEQFHASAPYRWGVGVVSVDYAGAAVARHLELQGKDPDRLLRHLIRGWNLALKNKIAVAFNCAVISLHQLSGDANSLVAGRPAKGTDAAECKSWRENTDFNLVFSNLDLENLCVVSLDKHRRTAGKPPQVLQLHGHIARVDIPSRAHVYDPISQRIQSKDDMKKTRTDDTIEEARNTYAAADDQIDVVDAQDAAQKRRRMANNS